MTKIKKALLSVLCCFALIFCSAFVFTACTRADMRAYNIKIDGTIPSSCSVEVIGDPIAGEEITVIPQAGEGYEYVQGSLKVNGKEIVGNKFIMPEGNVNVTAKFKKINYAVNTGNIEHGTIDIEVNEQNIATGDKLEWDTKVTLTPVPEKGYECTHLEVLNGGLQVLVTKEGDKYSFNMPQGNITINATFEKITYSLAKASEHGTFTIPATANYGDIVEVTGITPAPGYVSSKIIVNGNTITGTSFKMPNSNTTVQVVFKAVEYTVSIANNVEDANIRLLKSGSSHYFTSLKAYYGDTITVSVTPDEGYRVSAIKVNGTAISGNSFVVTENSEVTVELTAIDYSITVNPSENGSIVSDKTTPVHVGDLITLTVNPDATYGLESLTIKKGDLDIARSVDGNTVTFVMPAGSVTISATFAQNVNAVNISTSENGNVSANPVNAVEGSEVELNITPNTGYELETLVVMYGGTPVTVTDNKFVMPAGNVTVSATFKKINYTIIKSETTNGSFTVQETATYGESVTISVTPATGYELDQILVDGVALEVGETSFIMPAHSVTITVTFKQVVYTIERTGTSDHGTHGTFEIQDTATYGEEVVITSNPEAGYEATYTVMCGETPIVVTDNKFTMPAGNVTISVSYTLASYTISVYESIEGNIENGSVSFDQTIANMGDEITITVEPNDGYSLEAISVLYDVNNDGNYQTLIPAKTANENEYVFNMIAYDVKIRAWFGIKNSITANEATNGTVEITGVTSELDGTFTANATEAFEGDTVTITATPNAGYSLKSLQVNNGTVATTETSEGVFTFAMPAKAVSVNAEFEETQYTIIKEETTNGSFSVQETATYGENVTISVTPATGYELDQILVDGNPITGTTFSMPAKDVTVEVTFKIYTLKLSDITYTTDGTDLTITGVTATVTTYEIPSIFVIDDVTYTVRSLLGTSSEGIDIDVVKVILPSTLTGIGNSAFRDCKSLESIDIPDGVTSIGNYAFYGCTGLTSVTIPDSVTSIGNRVFGSCTSLTSITIPSSVTSIGNYAFYGCSSLTSITIPEGVTIIDVRAFSDCTSLTSITIPNSVTSIAKDAFSYSGLTSIIIPSSVGNIGAYAFNGCTGLTSITIPSSVTSIGTYVFSGCTGLTSITFSSTTPPTIGGNSLNNCTSLTTIYVPAGSKTAYETALANSGFTGTIVEQ